MTCEFFMYDSQLIFRVKACRLFLTNTGNIAQLLFC